jgi:hypothetical protein
MANWPDNKAPRHDVDDSTPRVVSGALLHSRHHTPDLPHRDQHATQAQEPDINAYNTKKLRAVGGEVTSLAFNPQADSLAICVGETSGPHAVYSYDLAARNNRTGAIEFDYAALAVAFRPDGKLLAIARADGGIRLYGPNAWQMP